MPTSVPTHFSLQLLCETSTQHCQCPTTSTFVHKAILGPQIAYLAPQGGIPVPVSLRMLSNVCGTRIAGWITPQRMIETRILSVLVNADIVNLHRCGQLGIHGGPVDICVRGRHAQIEDERHWLHRYDTLADIAIWPDRRSIDILCR